MRIKNQDLRAFTIGAAGYNIIELVYRRKTHWSMALAGGFSFMLMHRMFQRRRAMSRLKKCLVSALMITGVEYAVGTFVNRRMKWNVWDYSNYLFNVRGQICPRYSICWFLLSLPMITLSNLLAKR